MIPMMVRLSVVIDSILLRMKRKLEIASITSSPARRSSKRLLRVRFVGDAFMTAPDIKSWL
jgi:hypothetical protein